VVSEREQALRDEAIAKKRGQEQLSESDEEHCRLEKARQRGKRQKVKKEKGEGGEPHCSKDSMLPVRLNLAGPACNTVLACRNGRVRAGGGAYVLINQGTHTPMSGWLLGIPVDY